MSHPTPEPSSRVLIVGAGPTGLVTALCLAKAGVATTVVERRNRIEPFGSRAVATERSALEVLCRLGCSQALLDRGLTWTRGRTYLGNRELFTIEFPEVGKDALPPFVNVAQYETEQILCKAAVDTGLVDIRWGHDVVEIHDQGPGVRVVADGPDGRVELSGDYAVACDGARSTVRSLLGLELEGWTYDGGKFLIADIRADLPHPVERRFWFDPAGMPGINVLILLPQPDGIWRVDAQIEDDDFDLEEDRRSGQLDRRIRSVIGDIDYEIVWLTMWRFHERMLRKFRHGRVFFAGDAAHLVAPLGARGMNSGIHDADNLAWKMALVLRGVAPDSLLDTYNDERVAAAAENVRVTDRTMQFIVPTTWWGRLRRTIILRGATRSAALRRRVDSGRFHVPHVYTDSPIVCAAGSNGTPGRSARLCPGQLAPDGPCATDGETTFTRLREVFGSNFAVLLFGEIDPVAFRALAESVQSHAVPAQIWNVVRAHAEGPWTIHDTTGVLTDTYVQGGDQRFYLARPDGHIAAMGPVPTPEELSRLLDHAAGRTLGAVRT